MKKLLAILLASAVFVGTFAFVGCGGDNQTDNERNNADISKPVMPEDSDLQTVSREKIFEEYHTFYGKMKESLSGKYRAYSCESDITVDNGEQRESDGQRWLDKTEKTTYTTKTIKEWIDDYAAINENGSVTGAVTNQRNVVNDNKVNSTNANLAYLNKNSREEWTKTGIQKDEHLYNFDTYEINENGEYSKIDRHLTYYINAVGGGIGKYYPQNIPCVQVTGGLRGEKNTLAITAVSVGFEMANFYIEYNDNRALITIDPEEAALCEKIELKNFEFTAKKNDVKFFASLKYTMEYTVNSDVIKTIESEYVVLFDLTKPSAVTALPSNGININSLSLNTVEDKIAYPELTSEQLTAAVKEGKEITVNIGGGGDKEKLVIELFRVDQVLPVVDGKVTIDGAEIKEYLDEVRKFFEEIGEERYYTFSLKFTYYYDPENISNTFNGFIYADY